MEFNEKLQELRKQKGLTQQELADSLYVSRTAVSKWESGRGYPGIESLRSIADFFQVTVDHLLSPDEVLTIAGESQKQARTQFRDLFFGLIDLCGLLLLVLPLFAVREDGSVRETSLLMLNGVATYLKIGYFAVVIGSTVTGAFTLALQYCEASLWVKGKYPLSVMWSILSLMLFTVSLQPYAAVFVFCLLAVKVVFLIKRQ